MIYLNRHKLYGYFAVKTPLEQEECRLHHLNSQHPLVDEMSLAKKDRVLITQSAEIKAVKLNDTYRTVVPFFFRSAPSILNISQSELVRAEIRIHTHTDVQVHIRVCTTCMASDLMSPAGRTKQGATKSTPKISRIIQAQVVHFFSRAAKAKNKKRDIVTRNKSPNCCEALTSDCRFLDLGSKQEWKPGGHYMLSSQPVPRNLRRIIRYQQNQSKEESSLCHMTQGVYCVLPCTSIMCAGRLHLFTFNMLAKRKIFSVPCDFVEVPVK